MIKQNLSKLTNYTPKRKTISSEFSYSSFFPFGKWQTTEPIERGTQVKFTACIISFSDDSSFVAAEIVEKNPQSMRKMKRPQTCFSTCLYLFFFFIAGREICSRRKNYYPSFCGRLTHVRSQPINNKMEGEFQPFWGVLLCKDPFQGDDFVRQLKLGDIIEVISSTDGQGGWYTAADIDGKTNGWVPQSYVCEYFPVEKHNLGLGVVPYEDAKSVLIRLEYVSR